MNEPMLIINNPTYHIKILLARFKQFPKEKTKQLQLEHI